MSENDECVFILYALLLVVKDSHFIPFCTFLLFRVGGSMRISDILPDEDEEEDAVEALLANDADGDVFDIMESGDSAFAMEVDDDGDEDADDDEIRPTDSLLVVAITEDEFSHLEVQLFSDDGNLYTHHDITLPEFPLCLAWLGIFDIIII